MTAKIVKSARNARIFRIAHRSRLIAGVFAAFGVLSMPGTLFGALVGLAMVWTGVGEVRLEPLVAGAGILALIAVGLVIWLGHLAYLGMKSVRSIPHLWIATFAYNLTLAGTIAVISGFKELTPLVYVVPMGLALIAFARDVRMA